MECHEGGKRECVVPLFFIVELEWKRITVAAKDINCIILMYIFKI